MWTDMTRKQRYFGLVLLAIGSTAGLTLVAATTGESKAGSSSGTIEHITIHGKSLEGNLEQDSPDRDVAVYLPPSYATKKHQRYPVLYLLHGYGRVIKTWVPFIGLPEGADRDISSGRAKEMIIVMPDANTAYGGSMYSSSPVTGDWETYITRDLVSYIDSHYRTIAARASRGLAGHSMGGYGVWRIAMKHPELYAAIYSLSPCCLMNNPQPPAQNRPAAPGRGRGRGPNQAPTDGGHPVNVLYGEAAAWSPNPHNPPLYFDLPVKDGVFDASAAARWVANSPAAMIDQYIPNLLMYKAIAMDVGLQDTLLKSIQDFDASLRRLNITHTFETFEGDHSNHLKNRIEEKVLPFFTGNLVFQDRGSKER
jgi:S-formylglutathione hydrolase FrmB